MASGNMCLHIPCRILALLEQLLISHAERCSVLLLQQYVTCSLTQSLSKALQPCCFGLQHANSALLYPYMQLTHSPTGCVRG